MLGEFRGWGRGRRLDDCLGGVVVHLRGIMVHLRGIVVHLRGAVVKLGGIGVVKLG